MIGLESRGIDDFEEVSAHTLLPGDVSSVISIKPKPAYVWLSNLGKDEKSKF
jgi:hypothetical protein